MRRVLLLALCELLSGVALMWLARGIQNFAPALYITKCAHITFLLPYVPPVVKKHSRLPLYFTGAQVFYESCIYAASVL